MKIAIIGQQDFGKAVMAAFLGTARGTGADALTAIAAATLVYTVAAERASAAASGPGSFAATLLDALAAIDPADVVSAARVREVAA